MDEKIEKRIREYKQDFGINTQRAELLKRNMSFLGELEKIKGEFSLGEFLKIRGERDTNEKISIRKFTGEETVEDRLLKKTVSGKLSKEGRALLSFTVFENLWAKFCDRSNIRSDWNGDLSKLSKHIKAPVEIFWIEGKEKSGPVLFLRIHNWTSLEDIRTAWHEVEILQNQIWEKQKRKTHFARDLCWYDLSRLYHLTAKQIAIKWAESFHDEIDLLVVRRIKDQIKKAEPRARALGMISQPQGIDFLA